MRLYVAVILTLALAATAYAGEDKYERMLKKWVKAKAMEGCFGTENTKNFILKMKKAKAMCSGKPAPELNLPMFQGKVRTSNALGLSKAQESFVDNKMRKAFIAKLMEKSMMDMQEDDDEGLFEGFFKRPQHRRRYTREAEDEEEFNILDLGDQMVAKLESMESNIEAEIGNITCVLQEVGMLNEDYELDVNAMDNCLEDMKWTEEETGLDRTWLKGEMKKLHQKCKDFSDSLPDSILNGCSLPHWLTRLHYFHKCAKFHKCETCMRFDVRNKITAHGMSVNEMADKAGMEEDELVGLMAMMFFQKM